MAHVPGKKELSRFIWDPFSRLFASYVNRFTSFIPPPPRAEGDPPRRVLLIHAHPCGSASFNGACYEKAKAGLLAAGHEVKPISLYEENFPPAIRPEELRSYMTPIEQRNQEDEHVKTLRKHTDLLQWCDSLVLVYPTFWYAPPAILKCDSLVLVYPTFWYAPPAILKGWMDRVFVPGVAFLLPSPTTAPPSIVGLVPLLTNITKVGVVTTYGSSFGVIRYVGDPGRRIISRDCTLLWLGMYGADQADANKREKFLEHVEEAYKEF